MQKPFNESEEVHCVVPKLICSMNENAIRIIPLEEGFQRSQFRWISQLMGFKDYLVLSHTTDEREVNFLIRKLTIWSTNRNRH